MMYVLLVLLFIALGYCGFVMRAAALERQHFRAQLGILEKEKERTARDLHDQVSPFLSKLRLNMDLLLIEKDENILKNIREENTDLIARVMSDLRQTTFGMMPRVLMNDGLTEALKDFCEMMERGLAVEISFSASGDMSFIGKQSSLNIYRIVQEIVNNALKHAFAAQINVVMETKQQRLILKITDNGSGFDIDNMLKENRTGLGLSNIRSRVALYKGDMSVDSKPAAGTGYRITFNINSLSE